MAAGAYRAVKWLHSSRFNGSATQHKALPAAPPGGIPIGRETTPQPPAPPLSLCMQVVDPLTTFCCCCCSSCFIRFSVFVLFCFVFFLSEVVLLIYDFFKWNYVYPSTGNAISLSLSLTFFGGFCTLSIFLFALCGPQQFDPHVFMFSGVSCRHFYDAFDKLVENLLLDVLIDEEWQGNLE